jgi:hypothetical protein
MSNRCRGEITLDGCDAALRGREEGRDMADPRVARITEVYADQMLQASRARFAPGGCSS